MTITMTPLRLSLCLSLLVSCTARPNWHHHQDVPLGKDFGLPSPVQPVYNEAQVAAAQAIRDAGEEAQLHMAVLKKKYMDIVRQHFYNAFAPVPFVKERPDHLEPDQYSHEVLAVQNAPLQPSYNHHPAEDNPCSRNILNCLHAKIPSRLGPAPSSTSGHRPCFGNGCSHVLFNARLEPIPKPAHTSHSTKKPSKLPHKHHRLCNRKQPDQNCHHRSTFWPTYATLKFSTKTPVSSTIPSKENNHNKNPLDYSTTKYEHLTLPAKFFDKATSPKITDEKFGFELLRANTTKLENEILGIPDYVIPKNGLKNTVTPIAVTQTSTAAIRPTLSTKLGTQPDINNSENTSEDPLPTSELSEISLKSKEGSQTIPPLKNYIGLIDSTTNLNFHTNDVIETVTYQNPKSPPVPLKSYEEEKTATTHISISPTTPEVNSEFISTPVNEEDLHRTTESSNGVGDDKLESPDTLSGKTATVYQNPELKTDVEFMTIGELLTEAPVISTQNILHKKDNNVTLENKSQEYTVQTLDSNLPETTSFVTVDEPTSDLLFKNTQTYRELTTQIPAELTNASENFSDLGKEESNGGLVDSETSISTTGMENQSAAEESTAPIIEINSSNSVTLESNEAREDTFTDSYQTDIYSTVFQNNDFRQTVSGTEHTDSLPAEFGDSKVDEMTTEMSIRSTEISSAIAGRRNDELSTEYNGDNYRTERNKESSSNLKVEEFGLVSTEQDHTSTETVESKVILEEQDLLRSTAENTEDSETEEPDATEYSPTTREEIFLNSDQPPSVNFDHDKLSAKSEPDSTTPFAKTENYVFQGETTVSIDQSIEVRTDLNTFLDVTSTETPNLTEINQQIAKIGDDMKDSKPTEENENLSTSTDFINERQDITTINGISKLREDVEGDTYTTPVSKEITSNNKELIEKNEVITTQDIIVTEPAEVPERRENFDDNPLEFMTPFQDHTVTAPPTGYTPSNKETTTKKPVENEEKSIRPNITVPKELIGRTDTPGLLSVSGDWTEEQTEDTTSILTENPDHPQSRSTAEEGEAKSVTPYLSATEIINADINEEKELFSTKQESTQVIEDVTVSNYKAYHENNSGKSSEKIAGTTSLNSFNENSLHRPYQNGVLKFTTEIESQSEAVQSSEVGVSTNNPGLILELNDNLNRNVRSANPSKDGDKVYFTTECILSQLGLPHGHNTKRATENNSDSNIKINNIPNNKTEVLQNIQTRESNRSLSTNSNSEDLENSNFYASTILELLPVIREGYRNNAFSEDDKAVIRSLFGDMKALMDEDTFERMTETTGDLLMGDGTSRFEEVIEDSNYDSSEDIDETPEEEIRLKRSKKHLQIVNDLLKKIPNSSKTSLRGRTQMNNKRITRSTQVSQAEASAILALLAEKGDDAVQLDNPEDEDEDEYEYYEDEDYRAGEPNVSEYEDDYSDNGSIIDLIRLIRRHRERKARAEES